MDARHLGTVVLASDHKKLVAWHGALHDDEGNDVWVIDLEPKP